MTAGEAAANIPGTPIAQSFQPTMQGVNTEPTLYLNKIGDRRYGFLHRSDCWDADTGTMVHTEVQQYETTFQMSALSSQNPATPTQMTASDLLNLAASILQSSVAIQTFESQTPKIGVQKVGEVRNPYFLDDREQWEASPSFDFVISHKQIIQTATPIVNDTVIQIDEV